MLNVKMTDADWVKHSMKSIKLAEWCLRKT